jgi:hypothetical protein
LPILFCSSTLAKGKIRSAKHKTDFTLRTTNRWEVNALSVSRKGQLLVGQWHDRQLHIYSANYSHVTSIKLPDDYIVYDAVWTPRGNIVYSDWGEQVVTMSQSGDVIQKTHILDPDFFSVSTDGVIYLISKWTIVYQSTDDGLTWSPTFEVTDGWQCRQVIKMSTDSHTDVLWTVVGLWPAEDRRLRIHTVDKQRKIGGNVTWRDITLPSHVIVSLSNSKLADDGHSNILVTDYDNRAVHVWSVSGQYDRQLVSRQQLISEPWCVAVDTQRHLMYVNKYYGVGVFELTYEPL